MKANESWKVFWDRCVTVVDNCRYDEPPAANKTQEVRIQREQHNANTLQKVLIDKFLDGVNPVIAHELIDKQYDSAKELYEVTQHTVAVLIDKGKYLPPAARRDGIGAAISSADFALNPPPAPQDATAAAIRDLIAQMKLVQSNPPAPAAQPTAAAATSSNSKQSTTRTQRTRRPRGDPNKFCTFHKRRGHDTSECKARAAKDAEQASSAAVHDDDFFSPAQYF